MLTIREYKKAESLEEAYTLNQKKSNRVIGGMIWLKMETLNVGTAIDLSGLGLDTIEETETEFRIGAMASLRALELHEGLAAYTNGAMRESVRHIVGVQLRNLATVGGSLYSRFGFSDVLTMFLVLDAQVELYKGGIVPLSEYAESPKDRDILVRIIVPKKNAKFNYQSVRISQTDIPVLTCASVKDENGYRFAIGARPARAQIYAQSVDKTAEQMAEAVRAEIKTGSSLRGSAEYRRHLAGVLVRRRVIYHLYKLPQVTINNEKVLLHDGEVFDIDGIKIECFLVPGHTWGHMVYLVDGKYLFTGDTIWFGADGGYSFISALAEDNKLAVKSLALLEKKLKKRGLHPLFITGHTGWTDNIEFAFAHKNALCSPFKKRAHDPNALYDAYDESDDTEENAKSGYLKGVGR